MYANISFEIYIVIIRIFILHSFTLFPSYLFDLLNELFVNIYSLKNWTNATLFVMRARQ